MTEYEDILRNEVVYDLGSEIINIVHRAAKLHGHDPHLQSMIGGALIGAIRELDGLLPNLKKDVSKVLAQ